MNENSIIYKRVHEVDVLFQQMCDEGLTPADWILTNSDTFNKYATHTRYGEDLVAVQKKLQLLIPLVRGYLQQQQQLQQLQMPEEFKI